MAQASQPQMNEFVAKVDEFMRKYDSFISPATRAEVYATGDTAKISEYESIVQRGRLLKSSIETVTGLWADAKRAYSAVTDVTSMYIGDAVDWLKDLFGGNNVAGLGALGVIQIPAAAFVITAIAGAVAMLMAMDSFLVTMRAKKIQAETGMSYPDALNRARSTTGIGGAIGSLTQPLIIAAVALVAWLYLGQKK
jgi:hypothetical protein